ncbi:CIR protein [Plasmodium chabaudi adami]|uniref:CIR protein n=1 Tax=Plasmodium chabaudi adami TaxID=5826 RepID=A0A1C6WQ03_PLACE|nr:CIR protein [Plasmodium chabaudi adami]
MSAHVCKIFDNLYKQLPDDDDKEKKINSGSLLYESFCPKVGEEYQKCDSDLDTINAGFIYLLLQLFDNVESEGEHEDQKDNYVYYGLMWASYKLQQSNRNNDRSIGLNDFFTDYVTNSEWYEGIKEHVESKMPLINSDNNIEHMSNIYQIFKQMCEIFSNNDDEIDKIDFMSYYESVKICGENILKKNSNNADTDTSGTSCPALYDVLKYVYNGFKKDCIKKINPPNNALPEIPEIEEIKETLKSDSEKLDSPDRMDEKIETQDDEPTNCEQINFTNDIEQQKNEETTDDGTNIIFLDGYTVPEYEITNYKPQDFFDGVEASDREIDGQIVLDGVEVSDIDIGAEFVLDEVELPDIEVGYLDAQEEFFYIDPDFSTFEDHLSHSVMEPKNMYFFHPDLDIEQSVLDNEQTDFDNQPQPHQINTLKFDDPFKHPENFSDNIMCKVHGPKSVYCNRIICNKIKIGVIALSIPIVLVFVYKYFPWKRTKKLKKTKKMKRVVNLLDRKKTKKIDINLIDDNKTMQITINSNDKKKATKRIINSNDKKKNTKKNICSDHGKTTLLFNIYKQMQLNPMPFIHLFMLLIFFIFKRKKDSIE